MKSVTYKFIFSCLILFVFQLSAEEVEQQKGEENSIQEQDTRQEEQVVVVIGKNRITKTEPNEKTKKLLKMPGIAGDPLSAVYSLPGVVIAGGDSGGEPAIRGSSPDDNAYYIDFMPVGYIFHDFGPSIFNENLVQNFDLLPAGFGAQYGEATGGVIDVTLRDPKNQDFSGTFDWSFLQTGLLVESRITDNQAFYASYRKSLIHLYIDKGEQDGDDEGITVYEPPQSDDYQLKYQWLIGNNQKLTVSAAGANDYVRANISEEAEEGRADPELVGDIYIDTGFDSKGMRWELFTDHGGYLSLIFSQLDESEVVRYGDGQFIDSNYQENYFRGYYQKNWFKNHHISLGAEIREFDFTYRFDIIPYFCTDHQQDCNQQRGDRINDSAKLKQTTQAIYLTDQWSISEDIKLDFGIRGEYNDYTKERIWMPRIAAAWHINDALILKSKAGKYTRFPDADTAIRKLGNPNIKSPRADHYSIGATYRFSPIWQASIDFYHKNLTKLPLALSENDPKPERHYSNDMSGKANGVELLVEREKENDWYAWASLSWSKSERTNELTAQTEEYYLDTPVIFNAVANYELSSRWEIGTRLTIRSGQKYTPIIGLRDNPNFSGHYLPVYGDLNSKTLPNYQRLDIRAEYKYKLWDLDAAWTFDVINVLGHKNIEGYYYAPDGNETINNFKIAQEEGIGAFPAIGFKLKF